MGIRIHKVIGYGLTDLQKNDPRISWERFNSRWDREESSFKDWVNWLLAHRDEIESVGRLEHPHVEEKRARDHVWFHIRMLESMLDKRDKSRREPDVERCIVHNTEGGNPRVLLFYPPDAPHWRRYDDTIDYYESTSMRPKVKRLPHGIYPYNSGLVRARPPKQSFKHMACGLSEERFDDHGPVWMSPGRYSMLVGIWDKKLKPLASGEYLKHLKEDFRPPVPITIIGLILWSGITTDPVQFINDLRPMIYTYWS